MNNKLTTTTKKISTIFFAIVLVTGTITLASSQSSFMVGANAQAQPYYGGGGMDNRYDDRQSYGMDSYGSSNYGNDNSYGYELPQYQQPSYQPDYNEPQYPSYGKDDNRDKIQKNIKNVDINKIKCINNNININGNNTGNINLGNKGQVAGEGYSGAYSSDSGSGYGGSGEGYYDGYSKKDKGFDCVINNNNTNIGGAGNQTIPPDDGDKRATLTVIKTVECVDENQPNSVVNGEEIKDCGDLKDAVEPSNFTIQITGNDPQPDEVDGSAAGEQVQIGVGDYEVEETSPDVDALLAANPNLSLVTTYEQGCAPNGSGEIEAGVAETCKIINTFTIEKEVKIPLTIIKTVECDDDNEPPSAVNSPEIRDCDDLKNAVQPSDFTIQITGNDPQPDEVDGSAAGEQVQIGVGDYEVEEIPNAEVEALIAPGSGITLVTTYEQGCAPNGSGEIEEGVAAETCKIINTFKIDKCLVCFADISTELKTAIEDVLGAEGPVVIPGTDIRIDADTIVELCEFLNLNPLELTEAQIEAAIKAFIGTNTGLEAEVRALVECLIDAGVIIEIPSCDDCFAELSTDVIRTINSLLNQPGPIPLPPEIGGEIPASVTNIALLCDHLEDFPIEITNAQISILVQAFVALIGPDSQTIAQALVDCLIEANVIIVTDTGLTASDINTDSNTNDLQITQGTEDSSELTAVEKMTKLKQQWLDLLP